MHNTLSVSIVICCYNSASRLPETLNHLLVQDAPIDLKWEVILVDNASTDNTAKLAVTLWPKDLTVPLKVVSEPKPGLTNARKRGLREAQYDLVCFVDDDNWLSPNWVRLVAEVMATHPAVGACGGQSEAVFESEPPFWFDQFQNSYAVGPQSDEGGDITWSKGHLWGAGLVLRKEAWEELIKKGFQFLLTDRKGKSLSSGGDCELCYALRLAGWRLWYEPNLTLRHYITDNRLTWHYLRRVQRGVGRSTLGFDPYIFATYYRPDQIKAIGGQIWLWQLFRSCYILIFRNSKTLISNFSYRFEGNKGILHFERIFARILELINMRSEYDRNILKTQHADWKTLKKPLISIFANQKIPGFD